MKEKRLINKIFVYLPFVFGILSLFSFLLYYYSCHHAPYTYIDVILLGSVFSFVGIVFSIVTRKSRNEYPLLWILGVISCMFGFIIFVFVFILLICLMSAKLQH